MILLISFYDIVIIKKDAVTINMTTIKDIAEKTNLSKSTVVRVINNSAYVTAENRAKIENAIAELNYMPNKLAQGLKNKKSRMIGHILPVSNENPFFSLIACNVEEYANRLEYSVLTKFTYGSNININLMVKDLMGHMVSGIIITSLPSKIDLKILEKYKIPLVIIERAEKIDETDKILLNAFKGSFDATNMLIENGHKKIVFIGREPIHDVECDRYEGYIQAMQKTFGKIPHNCIRQVKGYTIEDGYNAAKDIFKNSERPTAFFCSSDILAVGAMQFFYEKDMKIPDDISIIGFGNTYSAIVPPTISTVANNFGEIGKNAIDMIIEHIENKRTYLKKLIIDPYIIDRGSVKNIKK
ncbi:MAG: LacI family transcriptional regulator [Treponema sp.]|nr:LacI family transcriptional regulator [Treponema sp.]